MAREFRRDVRRFTPHTGLVSCAETVVSGILFLKKLPRCGAKRRAQVLEQRAVRPENASERFVLTLA